MRRPPSFLLLTLLLIASAATLHTSALAEDMLRIVEGRAILSVPSGSVSSAHGQRSMARVERSSVGSFDPRQLADGILMVTTPLRSTTAARGNGSARVVRYRKSRNPCRTAALRRVLRNNPLLRCDPDWEVRSTLTPNDPRLSELYAMGTTATSRINARTAWDTSIGSADVAVMVIDTGIDYTHPDLAANIWSNPGEVLDGIDNDANGRIDDMHGIDRVNNDSNPMDDHGHGTHCAGTIGGVGNNGIGVVGVAWNVKLIGCKFLAANGSGFTSGAIECLNYARSLRLAGVPLRVTNNSWGGGGYSSSLLAAIEQQRDAGIVFAAAAGNENENIDVTPSYPAAYNVSNIISVAAVDSNGNRASFSNYGATNVDIGAPGVNILSTVLSGGYASYSGTSMATPHVAGAIALLASANSAATASQLVNALLSTGRPLSSLNGVTTTGKTLDVAAAISSLGSAPSPTPTRTSTSTATRTPTATSTSGASATPTVIPSATSTPRSSPIATNTPLPPPSTPTVLPTAVPTQQPTAQPSPTPTSRVLLSLSSLRNGRSTLARCQVRVARGGTVSPIQGLAARFVNASSRSVASARTNSAGIASASIPRSDIYRCHVTVEGQPHRSAPLLIRAR